MASRASGELAVTAFLRVSVAMLWLDRCFEGETCLDPGRERELPAPLEVVGDGGTMMPDDVIIIVLKDPRRSL